MNRKQIMIALSILTAITLVGQYIMTGALGLGDGALPEWFHNWEKGLWGFRALVEIGVVVYIGSTKAETRKREWALWAFEGLMIALIIATIGPVWASFQLDTPIYVLFGKLLAIGWSFLLAGISATMLAGVSYAYRVQPHNSNLIVLEPDQHQSLLDRIVELTKRATDAEQELTSVSNEFQILKQNHEIVSAQLQGLTDGMSILKLLPASFVIALSKSVSEDGVIDASVAARVLDVDEKYARRLLKGN